MKKHNLKAIILVFLLVLSLGLLAGCGEIQEIPTDAQYSYVNPEENKAETDSGFVIDGVLDEQAYQDNNWLYLHNSDGGNNVSIAMTSHYGEKGMYFVYDVTESVPIYVNLQRASYLNSCIEMYFAPSSVTSLKENSYFEVDMMPTGDMVFKKSNGKGGYVNVATTADMMAVLGATTKGGPVNTEECYGYNLELFIPWEYMSRLGLDAEAMKDGFVYVDPAHITSNNFGGTDTSVDRYWYFFAQQQGAGFSDVYQYFRFDADGVMGTEPVTLTGDAHCTVTGDQSVIPGMQTTVTVTPESGYAITSIKVNGQEMIEEVSFNADGSVTLITRGQKDGLTVTAATEAVSAGNKTLKGTVTLAKPGGDSLDGVQMTYTGPTGEKPLSFDEKGNFEIADAAQGHYVIKAEKDGYTALSQGVYLNRDMTVRLTLQYNTFYAEKGTCWLLDQQNEGILRKFGGSGYLLSTDSYNKFTFSANFFYDEALPKEADTDYFTQQRSGMRILFSNGKYWHIDMLKENGKYIVQYAKHSGDGSVFKWKEVCVLNEEQIAKYTSQQGIKLTVQRDGQYAALWLEDSLVAIEKLDDAYASCTAQLGFESWVANRTVQDIPYTIVDSTSVNLRNVAFRKEGQWDISGSFQNYLTSPASVGDTGWIWTHDAAYRDIALHVADSTPDENNFKMAVHFKFRNGEEFRLSLTNADTGALGTYKIQVLDKNTIVKNWRTHYELSQAQVAKLTGDAGIDFRVAIVGDRAIVYLDNIQVCSIDLSKDLDGNETGIAATAAQIGIRLYGNEGYSSKVSYDLGGKVKESSIQIEDPSQVAVIGTGHLIGETVVLTPPDEGCRFVSLTIDGKEVKLTDLTRYSFTATAAEHKISAVSTRVQDWDPTDKTEAGWDVSKQESGILGKKASSGDTDWLWTYGSSYRDISLTVSDKTPDANDFRAGIHFTFTDGNALRISLTNADSGALGVYKLQLMSGNTILKNWSTAYELTPEEAAKLKGEGMTFRAVVLGESVNFYLDGKLVASYALPGIADANAKVGVRLYGNSGTALSIPYTLGDGPEYHTLRVADCENGKVKANAKYYLPGDTATVYVVGNTGYAYDELLVNGASVVAEADGTYSFAVNADAAVSAAFLEAIFMDYSGNAWNVANQNKGFLFIPGTSNGTGWMQTKDQYNELALTVKDYAAGSVHEYAAVGQLYFENDKAVTIRFIYNKETGEYKLQSMNDSVFKWKEHYTLNQQQAAKVQSDGVVFRMTRDGTELKLYLDDVLVKILDLTGNESGITADMACVAKVRYYNNGGYDVILPFAVGNPQFSTVEAEEGAQLVLSSSKYTFGETVVLTPMDAGCEFVSVYVDGKEVTLTDKTQYSFTASAQKHTVNAASVRVRDWNPEENAGHSWDLSRQTEGVIISPAEGSDTGWMWTYDDCCRDVSLTVSDKTPDANNFRAAIHFAFTDANAFRVSLTNADSGALGVYKLQLMSGNTNATGWDGAAVRNWATAYSLTEDEVTKLKADGLTFRAVILGEGINLYLDGKLVASYALPGIADANAKVGVRLYGNNGVAQSVPYTLGTEPEYHTLNVTAGENGKIKAVSRHYLPGETVALTVAGDAGYAHDSFSVDDVATMTDNAGNYSFSIQKDMAVAATFTKALFKPTVTGWALENQHYGKVQVTEPNANGHSGWLDFADSYGDVDITLVAREYPDTEKPDLTRSAIRFMFGDKNITFSIAKNKVSGGHKYSIQSLSGDNIVAANYDFYVLNQAQIDKFNSEEGISLRVIRQGTLVDVYLDGVQVVDAFDLTQNDSGITADSQVKLTVRRYDDPGIHAEYGLNVSATAPQAANITLPTMKQGTVTTDMKTYLVGEQVIATVKANTGYAFGTLTVNGNPVTPDADGKFTFTALEENTVTATFRTIVFAPGNDWDISQQESGVLKIADSDGDSGWIETNRKDYQNVDFRLTIRDQKNGDANLRAAIRLYFENDQYVSFTVTNDRVDNDATTVYELQTMGGTILNWKFLDYTLTDVQVDALTGADGLEFRVVRAGTYAHIYLGGEHVYEYDMGTAVENQLARVCVRYYGNSGLTFEVPFSISEDVQAANVAVSAGENGKITTDRKYYLVGETVALSVAGDAGFAHDSFTVGGVAAMTDNAGKYSFVAGAENTVAATFKKSLFKDTTTGWALENQHYGKLQVTYTNNNGNSNWLDFVDSYGDVDITLVAREYPDTQKPNLTRSAIRFTFPGTKEITFSIAKNTVSGGGYKYSVQSLSGDDIVVANYDFYVMDQTQIDKFNSEEGIALRVIRQGTLVDIYLDGVLVVDDVDLTQNGSGVTADSKAALTIRRYDDPGIDAEYTLIVA